MEITVTKKTWLTERMIQIIPADGWHARYKQDDGKIELSRLQCFALVERTQERGGPEQTVHGMDADVDGHMEYCDEVSNFLGYVHKDDPDFSRTAA